MRIKHFLSLAAVALLFCTPARLAAQDLETGYFLGGNPYAFRLNPAFQSERNILSIALGGQGAGVWSNLGVSTLLYPGDNGYLYTFLNDRVNAADFMKQIRRRNVFDADGRVNLFTLGFWADRRFFTLDLNVRSLNAVSLPRDVFAFLKDDTVRTTYDFSGMGARADEYAEFAFGWSKNYDDVLTVGFRTKALVGLGELELMAPRMSLSMDGNRVEALAQSYFHASSPAFSVNYKENGELDLENIYFNEDRFGIAGWGGALDLGVRVNVFENLTLSASLLDFGAIRWNREINGISPESSYSWSPSDSEAQASDDWEEEVNRIGEELSGVIRFRKDEGAGAAFAMLPFQYLLGAEFRMPFYDRLTVGALFQGRGGSVFAHQRARFSLNWNPVDFLSLSGSTALDRLGESFGFAVNLHPTFLNLMLGCDYVPFHVVPLDEETRKEIPPSLQRLAVLPRDGMRMNFYLGLNFAFGRSRLDHAKRFR